MADDGTVPGAAATCAVTIVPVDDAPVVATTAGTTAFMEAGGAVTVDAGVTVTDVDSANLVSATVTITNPQDGADEVLAATCPALTVTPGLNSLTLSGSQPLATYEACLASATYDNASLNPDTTGRVISFVANDGTSASVAATKTVTLTPVDDAPVVTTSAGATAFAEGDGAVTIDGAVTVTDVDSANLASATVTITNPQDGASEVLAAGACAGLTVTPGLNSLSITGAQPSATYQTCLASVTYDNGSDDPGTTARVISFVVDDGTSSSVAANKTVTVNGVNDTPVVTTTGGNASFTEDGGAVTIDGGLTVTDVDSANLASATVTITNPQDGALESLSAGACVGLTVTPGLHTVSITGSQPPATYQSCLASVTFDDSSQDPDTTARIVSFVVSDGAAASVAATKTVTITAVDDAPVVATTGGSTAFTEDGGAVTIDGGVTVTDVDSANLASATVTITNPQDGAAEVLDAGACAGLTVTPGLHSLSLTGAQPPATYQSCLASVTFNDSSQNPGTTARVISFVVNDGTSNSVATTKSVTVTPVNDAPVVTTSAGVTGFTEGDAAVAVDGGVTVLDVDSASLASATVTITNPQDGALESLSAGACVGLTVTPGLHTLSITGSQPPATYQSCLASVTFDDTSENPGTTSRVISFVASDGSLSSVAATRIVTVTAIDDAPVVTTRGGTSSFIEGGGAITVDAGVTVTDIDSANLASATVTITNPQNGASEVLAASACGGLTVTPGFNSLAISGSQPLATYQSCLASVSYDNSSDDPGMTGRVVSFVVDDGTSSSVAATKTVAVTPVNDPPTVTTTGGVTGFTEDLGAVTVDVGLIVTDPDNANLASATVTITATPDGGAESLGVPAACPGLAVTPGNPLTVVGAGTVAAYQSCLRTVTYNNTSQNPSAVQRTVRFGVNDGADPSNNGDKAVSVTPVNDPPIAGADAADFIGNTLLHLDNALGADPAVVKTTGSGFGVLDNDSDPAENDPLTITGVAVPLCADATPPFNCATANGGTVVLESNGRFTYTPMAGDAAASDTFQYRLSDGTDTVNGLVTLTRFGRVWYVENDSVASGLGRSADPFDTLIEAQTASVANDTIFVFTGDGATTGQNQGVVLKSGQRLVGEGVQLTVPVSVNGGPNPTVLRAAGARPLLGNSVAAGNGVSATDAIPAEIVGLSLAGTAHAIDVTLSGAFAGSGTLAIRNNVFRGAGAEGLDVNAGGTGTLTLDVGNNTWNTAGTHTGNAVDIARTGGLLRLSFSGNANVLSAATAINVAGGAAASTTITGFSGNSVHQNTAGSGIVVSNATFDATPGGAYNQVSGGNTVVGTSGDGVGGAALALAAVAGDLAFTDLDLFAGAGAAFALGGTGAVNVPAGTGTRVTVGAGVAIFQSTGGPAVDVASATVDLQPTSIQSTNSPTTGVSLVGVADGTTSSVFSAGGGSSITNAAGTAFHLDGGNATVSYGGTIANTAGRSVVVQNRTADSATFTGAVTDTGTGILLNANTGSTVGFTGTLSLSTGANAAFTATGGGTVTSTGAASTLTTTTGIALNVANTTIGGAGLTFRSITAGTGASGPSSGIVLNNTGANAGLTVTGTGGAGSGGTIQRTTSDGVSLIGTRSISLSSLNVSTTGRHGVHASGVSGLSLTGCQVTTAGDGDNEHGLNLVNVQGTVAVSGTTLSGAAEDLIHLDNTNTNVALQVSGASQLSFPASIGSFANDAILLIPNGTSAITATISGNTFSNVKGDGVQLGAAIAGSSGTSPLTVTGNTFNVTLAGRASSVTVSGQESTTTQITITGNTFSGAGGNGVIGLDANDTSTISGTVSGNVIGSPPGIGIFVAADEGALSRVVLDNNSITNSGGDGIEAVNFGGTGVSNMDLVITNNTVNGNSLVPAQAFLGGIGFVGFEDNTCLVVRGNTVTGTPAGPTACGGAPCLDYYLEEVGGTTRLEEVPNTGAVTASVAYVQSINNPGAASVTVNGVIDLTNGTLCPRP